MIQVLPVQPFSVYVNSKNDGELKCPVVIIQIQKNFDNTSETVYFGYIGENKKLELIEEFQARIAVG